MPNTPDAPEPKYAPRPARPRAARGSTPFRLVVAVSGEQLGRLQVLAEDLGTTVSDLVREALEEYYAEDGREIPRIAGTPPAR